MINVLLDPLPTEWNGYELNTDFRIGIQIMLLNDDSELSDFEKVQMQLRLLFEDEDGEIRETPSNIEDLGECISYFINGWNHDNSIEKKEERKLLDFDVDQFRIYADFRQIYGINLNTVDLHWWEFMGMLWNMPHDKSSFMQVIDIRKKKIKPKMSAEEKKAIQEAQQIYGLGKKEVKKVYTPEEARKIDDYDKIMSEKRKKKELIKKIATTF